MKKLLIGAAAFALIALAPAAFAAGSATGTLTVNASVAANCTIGAGTLNFGAYDPVVTNSATALDASTTMAVACTKGVNPSITTATPGGAMTGGGDSLNYLLFSDSGRLTSFVPGFSMGAAPGKASRNLNIYGRVASGQDVGVAAYSGTITFTVNF